MGVSFGLALCLAYIVGLLISAIAGYGSVGVISVSWAGVAGLLLLSGWGRLAPRPWRLGWLPGSWCGLGVVILLAALYMPIRSPVAGAHDVSQFLQRVNTIGTEHIIVGRAIEDPRLNRDLKGRLLVAAQNLQVLDSDGAVTFQTPVSGRVYVTAPLLQVTGLHAGQQVTAKGRLYRPQPAMNPNGFDFQAYLTQQGAFTGLVAHELTFDRATGWGLWQVRQRIVRTQVRALGSPLGQLVSAMALGRKAVDLPSDIQDVFMRVGLAHTVAASGFHVSLLLGVVLALLRSRSNQLQAWCGLAVLVCYVLLTGAQASVIRAALMGGAALLALATNRRVRPAGALIMAATVMLLINPTWLWSVSFQLSVMATWGLIVTVPTLMRRLDWLPVMVASLVAVPIAATLWTLPLTLYHFNVLAGLSIVLNVVAMPLVTVISLGGIASSALALVFPPLGGIVAHGLYYPAAALWWLAQTSSQLPGSSIAIGQISRWQLFGLYLVLLGLWGGGRWLQQRQGWLRPMFAIAFLMLIVCPLGWRWAMQDQVTVLAAGEELIWVQQDHGQTTLINSGDAKTAFYTVEPFLTQAGINHLESAIALPFGADYRQGWQRLLAHVPTAHLYSTDPATADLISQGQFHPLQAGTTTDLSQLSLQLLGVENPIVRLSDRQDWLLLPELPLGTQEHLAKTGTTLHSEVLVWAGDELSPALVEAVAPQVAICYGRQLSESLERQLQRQNIQVFWTHRDGAITWQPQQGFRRYLSTPHRIQAF
jgi:competence protein ComEC